MNSFKAMAMLVSICLIAACGLTGKKGNDNSGSSSNGGNNSSSPGASDGQLFTAQVNGQAFSGKNIRATITTIGGKPFFNITAFSHDLNYTGANKQESIGFNVAGELKSGDYSFGEAGKTGSAELTQSHGFYNAGSPENDMPPNTIYRITTGKLSITQYNDKTKTAAGTFQLTTVNEDGKTVKIENGQFSNIAF